MRKCLMVFVCCCLALSEIVAQANREFYQLVRYQFSTTYQEASIDNYLSKAYMPALKRIGLKNIGVFKPITNDTSSLKSIYILSPLRSLEDLLKLNDLIISDKQLQESGKEYLDALYTDPPYSRMESTILKAFELSPSMKLPKLNSPKKDRIYELRSYEGYTEKIYRNKVEMFNAGGEIALFNRLNFNAVFYGEVISGSRMPNLVYLTTFENREDRDAHWKAFGADPEWKKLSTDPRYQKNVSRNETILMRPAEYSDY